LRDARGNSIYYAHLERQAVSTGQHVSAGEILGFVGNTGNAITTPPHLHFGVYRRGEGPLDPYWFVHHARGELARLSADTALLGDWARTANERTMLRRAPNPRAESLFVVPRHTALRIVAAIGSWYHVRLPDGATGYVPARLTEPADRPVEMTKLPERAPLLAHPRATASPSDVLAEVTPGESVGVLARFGAYLLVLARGGTAGWVSH
jgi:murein DD-endopeptidase MepM/ murein hydrolase activator NlpD